MGLMNKQVAAAAVLALVANAVIASEDFDLRYAPGIGGADMSAPFEGGWAFQAPVYVYSGNIRSSSQSVTDLTQIPFVLPIPGATATTTINANTQINVSGVIPRLSFMSAQTFLGAQIGGTAALPLLHKKSNTSITGVDTVINAQGLPAPSAAGIYAMINGVASMNAPPIAAANSDGSNGIGDLEVSPMLRWSTDTSQVLLIGTVVLPTGRYNDAKTANPGTGEYFTFRPAVQYSLIGDGWDLGTRAAFSINSTNSHTHYRTGDYLNIDATLMKSLDDSWRIGASGYLIAQTTSDKLAQPTTTSPALAPVFEARQAPTVNQRGHVLGLGPEIAYLHGAGDYLLDGRMMKEFDAKDRPEGFTAVVSVSKPF